MSEDGAAIFLLIIVCTVAGLAGAACYRYAHECVIDIPEAPPLTVNSDPTEYVVQPGDTLSGIAKRRYGDPSRWAELQSLNNLPNPDALRVGQVLRLP